MLRLIGTKRKRAVPAGTRAAYGVLIAVLVIVFVTGMGLLVGADYRRTTTEAVVQVSHTAELVKRSVESSLANANMRMWDVIDRLPQSPLRDATWAQDAYGPLLRRTVGSIPQIDSLVLIDPDGTVLAATVDDLVGKSVADRGYFQRASALGHFEYAVGIPIISRGNGNRITPIAWPLLDEQGRLRGVLASGLGEDYFADLLSLTGYGSDLTVMMMTANGDVAFSDGTGSAPDREISVSKDIPALDLAVTVSRPRAAAFSGFNKRTLAFVTVATVLFATALGMAISSLLKSFRLAEGLRRRELAQREFDTIFQNVADGIVIFDKSSTLHRSNRMARELLEAATDRDAVVALRRLLPPVAEIDAEPTTFQLALPGPDGAAPDRVVQARVMTISHQGHRIFYCVLADLTAQEKLASMRESFITSVNHELRTPLTSLAGSLDLLQARYSADLPATALKLVDMASRNSDRLLMLVNDILTLQAIDQGKLSLRMERIAVSDVLEEAVLANAGYGLGARVALELEPFAGEAWIDADRDRLQQILSNIISNAIKYSPKAGRVTIGAFRRDDAVAFWVRDHGPGIPAGARDRLFQRFARPVHGNGVQASGTGLGLAITRELVQRQGGEISFASRLIDDDPVDHGTTFSVSFPIRTDLGSAKEAA